MVNYRLFFNSIRFKLIFIFVVFIIPLNILLIVNNNYAIKVVRSQVAKSNTDIVSLYMGQIDRNLEEVDKYLYNMAAINTDLLSLELPEKLYEQKYNFAKLSLSNLISADINNYRTIDGFFVYSEVNKELIVTPNLAGSYEERSIIENDIKEIFKSGVLSTSYQYEQWIIRKIDDKYFVCHIVRVGKAYIGAWVNTEKLMVPLNLVDLGQNGKAVLAVGNVHPMKYEDFFRGNNISLGYEKNSYKLTGDREKYLVVGEKSSKGDFSLIAVIPDSMILERLPYIQKLVSLIPIASVIIIAAYLIFLTKVILYPINKIVTAMRKIKSGEMGVQIALNATSLEFDIMNRTFNSMVSQIKELKIKVYEEQISKQKAELKHLQLQINPHFFLNSLNVIYQLAQVKDFKLIQEMAFCLIEYFRYMFRSNLTFVLLEDEIKHTQNYLKIQEMRFPEQLTYSISVPDYLSKYLVPPLMVQSFVENSIKHAITLDNPIHISVDASLDGSLEEPSVKITISDTGKGFSNEILSKLQQELDTVNELGEHIGIWNVKQRLRLLYMDKAAISFFNKPDGGASIQIVLPLNVENIIKEAY